MQFELDISFQCNIFRRCSIGERKSERKRFFFFFKNEGAMASNLGNNPNTDCLIFPIAFLKDRTQYLYKLKKAKFITNKLWSKKIVVLTTTSNECDSTFTNMLYNIKQSHLGVSTTCLLLLYT